MRVSIIMVLSVFWGLGTITPDTQAEAAACNPLTVTSSGTATSQRIAERNAKVSLMAQLEDLYPGEFRSRMMGPVEYDCKNPLLWRCAAKVKICN